MLDFTRRTLPAALLILAATGCTRVLFRPTIVTQVPDGMEVRYRVTPSRSEAVVGRALGWMSGTPRLVTSRGDTIVIPNGARLEFKVDHPSNHAKAGAVLGYLISLIVMQINCNRQHIQYCGEQDPTPLLGILVGGIIGSFITKDWVPITWNRE
jgi:hypothetical protein